MSASVIDDPTVDPSRRLDGLARLLAAGERFPEPVAEANNHVHTCYSFSPYTPTAAALGARRAGLIAVGSVDHDSLAAADEMRSAAAMLSMGAVTGFEQRAFLHSADEVARGAAPMSDRLINNPDSPGGCYLTVQAVPARARAEAAAWLAPVRRARAERTAAMTAKASEELAALGLPGLDFEADVAASSRLRAGGTVTERHLLAAVASRLIAAAGPGRSLVDIVAGELGVPLSEAAASMLAVPDEAHLLYDLLGALKAGFLARVYVQPERARDGGECPDAADVVAFAERVGAIACYAYLGDVAASPTGDKADERFEDAYLPELLDHLRRLGFWAVTHMPPRNTPDQRARIGELADERGMLQVSGVDINSSRQSFACPELRSPQMAGLNDATWAMAAHEALSEVDPELRLAGATRADRERLAERVALLAPAGRALAAGESVTDVVAQVRQGWGAVL